MITPVYLFALILVLSFLILKIMRLRMREQVGLGDARNPELMRAIRAHGNFIEMVPFALIIMVLLELQSAPPLALHLYGAGWVVARIAHAQGLYQSAGRSWGRTIGAVTSLFLLVVGAAAAAAMAVF